MMDARTLDNARRANGAERLKRLATYAAVAVAFTLIVAKVWAWIETGSVAMFASLVDSALDLLASGLNLLAVHHALTPADEEHRFGHGKAEAIAGLGQAAFIAGSSAFLIFQSIERMVNSHELPASTLGIVVMLFSIALTLGLVLFQRYVVARTRSLAIGADRLHYVGDIATNAGVIAALVLSGSFGLVIADPLIGLAIACVIGWGAVKILRASYDELMDREFADADRERIKHIVKQHMDVVSLHDLRTRHSGHRAFIQLHLELAPEMSLVDAHRISDEVEDAIRFAFPDAEVLIHQDPAGFEMNPTFPRI
ncbi:MAG: cation diffusion facilitator family transporter [Alphaproteobacteria bacterium]|nr:cation diffusion facilitator family transporter [Alphaproteobacteria bacterium]